MSDTDMMKRLLEATPETKRAVAGILNGTNTHQAPKSTKLIEISTTARRLGVGRTTVYKLIEKGSLRCVKLGADRRVVEQSILDYLGI